MRAGAGAARRRLPRCGEALLDALDRDLQALALGGLQHVVDDALLEGLDRVLVVGGDEDDLAAGPAVGVVRLARRRPAAARSRAPPRRRSCRACGCRGRRCRAGAARSAATASMPFFASADDLELGPDLGEARAQLLAHQPLVVGDDGAREAGASVMVGSRSGAGRFSAAGCAARRRRARPPARRGRAAAGSGRPRASGARCCRPG